MKKSIGQRLKELVGEVESEEITNNIMVDVLEQRIENLNQQLNNAKSQAAHYLERFESIIEHNKIVGKYLNYSENYYFTSYQNQNFMVCIRFKNGKCEPLLAQQHLNSIMSCVPISEKDFYK